MPQHKTVESTCPWCGTALDGATNARGRGRPSPGAYTICTYCFEPCVYGQGLRLEKVQIETVSADLQEALRQATLQAVAFRKARSPS